MKIRSTTRNGHVPHYHTEHDQQDIVFSPQKNFFPPKKNTLHHWTEQYTERKKELREICGVFSMLKGHSLIVLYSVTPN